MGFLFIYICDIIKDCKMFCRKVVLLFVIEFFLLFVNMLKFMIIIFIILL